MAAYVVLRGDNKRVVRAPVCHVLLFRPPVLSVPVTVRKDCPSAGRRVCITHTATRYIKTLSQSANKEAFAEASIHLGVAPKAGQARQM